MKTRHLHFVLEEAQYQKLRRAAFGARISIGEYLRRLIEAERGDPAREPSDTATHRANPGS
jgi:hypothetical protein